MPGEPPCAHGTVAPTAGEKNKPSVMPHTLQNTLQGQCEQGSTSVCSKRSKIFQRCSFSTFQEAHGLRQSLWDKWSMAVTFKSREQYIQIRELGLLIHRSFLAWHFPTAPTPVNQFWNALSSCSSTLQTHCRWHPGTVVSTLCCSFLHCRVSWRDKPAQTLSKPGAIPLESQLGWSVAILGTLQSNGGHVLVLQLPKHSLVCCCAIAPCAL